MIDNTSNTSNLVGPDDDFDVCSAKVMAAVRDAQEADRIRESLPTDASPGQFLALSFIELTHQPHVLLHTLALPEEFKFSIYRMANRECEDVRSDFRVVSRKARRGSSFIFMDFRAPVS